MEKNKGKIVKKSKKSILIKRIAFTMSQIFAIVLVLFILLKVLKNYKINNDKKVKDVNDKIVGVKNEAGSLEEKSFLTKKYIELWSMEITEKQKEMNGISIEAIKDIISKAAVKHYITNIQTNFSTPETILSNGVKEEKGAIVFMTSEVTIKFNSLTEYPLYYLIQELDNAKIFFFDLENFSIRKVKNLDKSTINNLINNMLDYVFEIELKLYVYNAIKIKG
jgi:hypothetical protein